MSQFVGTVIGTKMKKTAKVSVIRMFLHPHVLKYVRKRKTFFAHDDKEECREGDLVMLKECQPISKRKYFRIVEVLSHGLPQKLPGNSSNIASSLDDSPQHRETT